MKRLVVFCLLMLLLSCGFGGPEFATDKQRKDAIQNAQFSEHIAVNQHAYDELVKFLEEHADTIISYRNSKNVMTVVDGGSKTHDVLEKQDCYNFFQGNSSYDITNVPDFLKAKLDTIYNGLGDDNIRQFKICKDKKIWVEVRTEGGENGLYISHSLLWNTKAGRDYGYDDNKDTVLEGNCIYRLGMREEHGH